MGSKLHAREVRINGVNDLAGLQRKAAYFDQIGVACDATLGRAVRELGSNILKMTPREVREYIHRSEEILEQLEQQEKVVEGLAFRVEKPSREAQSLLSTQQVIDAYLTDMEDGGAAEGYVKVRARKLRFFARQHPQLPTDPGVIHSYLRQFKTADVPTRQDQWKALSALYKFAAKTLHIANPMVEVDKPRFKKKPGQRLSRDQAKRFLSAVETNLEWAAVTCYFGLRFRRIEAERLHWGDVKDDYIVVTGKERTEELPLLSLFREKLLRLRNRQDPSDPVFPIKGDTLAYHIRQIFKRAKITGVRGSPHTLRNTAGRLWLTFGGDDRANRQLLRHSPQTQTDYYSILSLDELMAMEERYNPMLNLMRELKLVPAVEGSPVLALVKGFTNTSSVREGELGEKPDFAQLISDTIGPQDPVQQLPDLIDQMIALGEMAQEIKCALGGNGHRAEQLEEVKRYLERQANK